MTDNEKDFTGNIDGNFIDEVAECLKDDTDLNDVADETAENEEKETKETEPDKGNDSDNEQKLGKFKNPQELLKAYSELEKEFTRRSQRLKEFENATTPKKTEDDWKNEVDKFFSEIPSAKTFAKDMANEIMKTPELQNDPNCLNIALTKVLADKFRTPEQLMEDGQFLNDYVLSSQKVRDAVIEDYLHDVHKGLPPKTMHDGGLQCVAPKDKPKTFEEAGLLFLKDNR